MCLNKEKNVFTQAFIFVLSVSQTTTAVSRPIYSTSFMRLCKVALYCRCGMRSFACRKYGEYGYDAELLMRNKDLGKPIAETEFFL